MSNAILSQLKSLAARWPGAVKTFSRPAVSSIGLDIGSYSVKGIHLVRSGTEFKIRHWAAKPYSSEKKAEVIRSVVESLGASKDSMVVTGLGGSGTVLRSVSFPEMSQQDLKAALSFEAEKYIPFKLDETFFDSCILGKRPSGRMEVLLAAARKELVNSHIELLTQAGVAPDVVDLEALSLVSAWELHRPEPEETSRICALLHVGARGTILNFFQSDQLQFTRETQVGGDAFTQAVAESLQFDAVEAEKIKCEPGDRVSQVKAALEPTWEDWLAQCRVSFDFYENQFGHKVERLVLSGGSSRLIGFKEKVIQAMGLPTDEWNPLPGVSSDADPELVSLGSAMAVAVGLAIRGAAG